MSDGQTELVKVIEGFGAAIRGDWGSIDGRTVRDQMESAAAQVVGGDSAATALADNGVCPLRRCWDEHCDERSEDKPWMCVHAAEVSRV
jgi:hypothetical protein